MNMRAIYRALRDAPDATDNQVFLAGALMVAGLLAIAALWGLPA